MVGPIISYTFIKVHSLVVILREQGDRRISILARRDPSRSLSRAGGTQDDNLVLCRGELALQFLKPIDHHVYLRHRELKRLCRENDKAQSIGRDVVNLGRGGNLTDFLRYGVVKCRLGRDLDRHQRCSVYIEQFPAVSRREGVPSPSSRDLPFPIPRRERNNIYFKFTRFVRRVRHPAAVGRDDAAELMCGCLEERNRFPVVVEKKHPEIAVLPEDHGLPVGGTRRRQLCVRALRQTLFDSASVPGLSKDVRGLPLLGLVHNVLAVRRPDGNVVVAPGEREPGKSSAIYLINPDIVICGIDAESKFLTVGREYRRII